MVRLDFIEKLIDCDKNFQSVGYCHTVILLNLGVFLLKSLQMCLPFTSSHSSDAIVS